MTTDDIRKALNANCEVAHAVRELEGQKVQAVITIKVGQKVINTNVYGKLEIYEDSHRPEDEMFVISYGKNSTEFSRLCIKEIRADGRIIAEIR